MNIKTPHQMRLQIKSVLYKSRDEIIKENDIQKFYESGTFIPFHAINEPILQHVGGLMGESLVPWREE